MTDQTIEWLRGLAEQGGKGVVNNIDARCLGRIADRLEYLQSTEANEILRLKSALVVAGTIMQRAVDCYYVASGQMIIDGQDGYGPLREMRLFLEGASKVPPAERGCE